MLGVSGAVNVNVTVAVPFAESGVADSVPAENVADPNLTAKDEIVDAATFVSVAVRVLVAPIETDPNASDVADVPPTDSPIGAGTVADSGTFSVNETPLTVPVITSVSRYGAGAPGAVNERLTDPDPPAAMLVDGHVEGGDDDEQLDGSTTLNGEDAPEAIANWRLLMAAPAAFDSVTATGLAVPTAVVPNDTDVTEVLLTVSPTGAETAAETGTASVN